MGGAGDDLGKAVGLTILSTIAFARLEETLFLCYRRAEPPEDSDWRAWLERLRVADFDKLLLSSPLEGGPNADQRRLVAEYWRSSGRRMPRAARLTRSPVARGAFTALSWHLRDLPMRTFWPPDLGAALQWLGSSVSPAAAEQLISHLGMANSE
jgi:hypothetical protein